MADLAVSDSMTERRSLPRAGRLSTGAIAGAVALGLSVFLLFALGAVIAYNQSALRDRFDWIQHTDDVLLEISTIQHDLNRMESDMRAYGLSSDADHMRLWRQWKDDSDARLARVAALISDNPVQSARLAVARRLIARWGDRWGKLAAHPSPDELPAIRENLARDLAQHPARDFQGRLDSLAGVERMLLGQREVLAARLSNLLQWLSVLLALAAPSVGLLGIYLLHREGNRVRARAGNEAGTFPAPGPDGGNRGHDGA